MGEKLPNMPFHGKEQQRVDLGVGGWGVEMDLLLSKGMGHPPIPWLPRGWRSDRTHGAGVPGLQAEKRLPPQEHTGLPGNGWAAEQKAFCLGRAHTCLSDANLFTSSSQRPGSRRPSLNHREVWGRYLPRWFSSLLSHRAAGSMPSGGNRESSLRPLPFPGR